MTAAPVAPEAAARRRRRRVALVILLVAVAAGVFRPRSSVRDAVPDADSDGQLKRPTRVVPDTVRIKVEVLNATGTRGLARLATAWLRDYGFDVVGSGSAPAGDAEDSTVVVDRSGHPEWAKMAAEAMGGARIERRADTLRYLDLTVRIGRSWRPPPQALYP